jgi:hypothetical protein
MNGSGETGTMTTAQQRLERATLAFDGLSIGDGFGERFFRSPAAVEDGTPSTNCDLPVTGKLGIHHSLKNYVVLTLPVVHEDERIAIYRLTRADVFEDRTRDYLSPRDRRMSR